MKRLVVVAAGLLAFGWVYAYKVAIRPIKPTWLEVVIGDAATDAGASVALWVLTHNWRAALVPWLAHAATGGPQVFVQATKIHFIESTAEAVDEYEHTA